MFQRLETLNLKNVNNEEFELKTFVILIHVFYHY